MWNTDYDDRLLAWSSLREEARHLPLEAALHLINDWWAQAPIVSHYLHMADSDEWPLPWDLLAENAYCDIAKCLGICYTILLIEHEDIKSLRIAQTDNYTIVQVNNGQYALNDQIGEIVTDQSDLHVKYSIDCEYLKNKIQ